MEISTYIPIIILFVLIFILFRNRKVVVARKVIKKRKKEDLTKMIEFAKRFIGKDKVLFVGRLFQR